MRKLLLTIFLAFLIPLNAYSIGLKGNLDKLIEDNIISKQSLVAVSVMDLKTGKIAYERNQDKLLHPASTLKLFTTNLALNTLGENYKFQTKLYQKGSNLYLKLDGDPYLETKDLEWIFRNIEKGRYNLFIDDREIDETYYGTGWMWDNFGYKYFPKQSIYALNHNTSKIRVTPAIQIIRDYPYEKFKITNNESKDYLIETKPWKDNETIYISGNFRKEKTFEIPVTNPKKHFKYYLEKVANKQQIYFSHIGTASSIPSIAVLKGTSSRPILDVIAKTNKESDNFAAEILLKKVGKKVLNEGSTKNGLEVFKQFYDTSNIEIVDASGVSHNNLLSANWIVQNLYTIYKTKTFKKFKNTLAMPKEKGTLQYRLIPFKNSLRAKTGTLSGVSAIEGYYKNKYCFAVLIQNYKGKSIHAKELENEIIQTLSHY